jgi:hypothetical protein
VAFDVQHVDVLHARTQQGLPVILGATFQVRTYPAVEAAVVTVAAVEVEVAVVAVAVVTVVAVAVEVEVAVAV